MAFESETVSRPIKEIRLKISDLFEIDPRVEGTGAAVEIRTADLDLLATGRHRFLDLLMHAGIENRNDLAIHLDAIGNVDDVGEDAADLLLHIDELGVRGRMINDQ